MVFKHLIMILSSERNKIRSNFAVLQVILFTSLWSKAAWKIAIGNRKYKNSETLKRDIKRYDIVAEVNNVIGISIRIILMNGIEVILARNSAYRCIFVEWIGLQAPGIYYYGTNMYIYIIYYYSI